MNPTMTHEGWLWFCPIHLGLDGDDCYVEPRAWPLAPVLWLCCQLESLRILLSSMFIRGYEPSFMFRITGRLE